MKVLIFLACLVVYANAHACLLFPAQRGGVPASVLTTQGDDACAHVSNPPCGGTMSELPKVSYKRGQNSTVTILKNLSHYYANNPGLWILNIIQDSPNGIRVGGIPDSYDFYTLQSRAVTIYIPTNIGVGGATLQLIYQTNNPDAPAYFYQCADITIEE